MRKGILVVLAAAVLAPAGAVAAPTPGAYQEHDGKGFRDILPPGTNGLVNTVQLAQFEATGAKLRGLMSWVASDDDYTEGTATR